jgi:hypothetical protein
MEFKLKDAFVCNFCREKCGGPCNQEILDILSELHPPKGRVLPDSMTSLA